MHYRTLGGAGVKVSSLCLGTMTFGAVDESSYMHDATCDEDTAHAILDRAVDAGINFVDTADVYGPDGLAERIVGNWVARGGRRDSIVLATKFRFSMGTGPNRSGASRHRIVRCVEESLRRLRTDRVDLLQVHMQDVDVPEEETLRALDDLVRAGKVLYIGCSNYTAYRMVDSQWLARTMCIARYVTAQMQYSLLSREIEREVVPACQQWGVGILPWSPLAGGFLSGKYRPERDRPSPGRLALRPERIDQMAAHKWAVLGAVEEIAVETGATVAQVALAWLLDRPHVSSVIFGARSLEQLEDDLGAAEMALAPEHRARLDDASAITLGYPYDFIARIQGRW